MTEPCLHHLERQLEPAVDAPVDAPGSVEVAQAVEARILGSPIAVDDAGGHLRRMKAALDDRVAMLDASPAVGEDEIKRGLGAGEAVFAQRGDQHWRQWHG